MTASRTIILAALLSAAIPASAQVPADSGMRRMHSRSGVGHPRMMGYSGMGRPMMGGMRGMGWMWAGPMGRRMMGRPMPGAGAGQPLPEPDSRGATLVSTYCTQCHATPSPTLHTAAEWSSVTSRMQLHMSSGPSGIKTPAEAEMRMILAYLQQHAR